MHTSENWKLPNNKPNMAPKFKKAKKTREFVDCYTAILVQRSTYVYWQLRGAATHSHREVLDKHSMGGKNLVLLFECQRSAECCCRSSESQTQQQ